MKRLVVSRCRRSLITATLVAIAALAPGVASAMALPTYLSDFLGVAPGTATSVSNAPYTQVIASSHGFGADSPGNFDADLIKFSDTGEFAKGIGAHPLASGETLIEFNLQALRDDGFVFNTFLTQVGIDQPSGGNSGARFNVYLDGQLVSFTDIANVNSTSIAFAIALGAADILGLGTQALGIFNGNHAAWGDARLEQINAVPVPAAVWLLGSAVAAAATIGRRRNVV